MQLTLHATRQTPHGAPRLVQALPPWSVKTRHAPSRHCRGAMVYANTTTAIHGIEYIPPIEYPPPPQPWHAYVAYLVAYLVSHLVACLVPCLVLVLVLVLHKFRLLLSCKIERATILGWGLVRAPQYLPLIPSDPRDSQPCNQIVLFLVLERCARVTQMMCMNSTNHYFVSPFCTPPIHCIGIYIYIYILRVGWVGVCWRRSCKTCHFVFWISPRLSVELDHFCDFGSTQGGWSYHAVCAW